MLEYLLNWCLLKVTCWLSSEVALDQWNVLEDRLVLIVVLVCAVDLGHCVLACELDVLELEEVANVEQTHRVVHANLRLWVTILEVNAPVPELGSVHAILRLESEVVVPQFAFKRSDVEFELVVNLIRVDEWNMCIRIFAKERQVVCPLLFERLTTSTDTAHFSRKEVSRCILSC